MVKKATGRDLVLDGPIALSLLPTPTVTLSGVKFFNVPGSKNPNMVEVKSVTVKPSLLALLTGNIEVSEVTLVEPKIVLEINAEGKPNWEFTPSVAEAKPAAPKPSLAQAPVARPPHHRERHADLQRFQGRPLGGGREGQFHAPRSARSTGRIRWPAAATINGAPLKLDLAVGAKAADGHAVDLAAGGGGGKLSLKGKLSELGPNARFTGIASSASDNLIGFRRHPDQDDRPAAARPAAAARRQVHLRRRHRRLADGGLGQGFQAGAGPGQRPGSLSLTLKPALADRGQARGRPARPRPLAGRDAQSPQRRRPRRRRHRPAPRRHRRRRRGPACSPRSPPSFRSRSAS